MASTSSSLSSTSTISARPALTTTFTPALSCLTDHYAYHTVFTDTADESNYYISLGPPQSPSATTCFPSGWDSTSQYFSPGICPSGYWVAFLSLSIGGTTITETEGLCCPSGFNTATTTQLIWGTELHITDPCTSDLGGTTTMAVTAVSSGTTITSNTVLQGGLNAYGISIRWQSTDLQPMSTSPTIGTGTLPTTTTASTTPTPNPESSTSSLSSGAKAGIAVGVILGVLLALSGAWFFVIKQKRAKARTGGRSNEFPDVSTSGWKSELAATENVLMLPRELASTEIVEAEAEARNRPMYELEAR